MYVCMYVYVYVYVYVYIAAYSYRIFYLFYLWYTAGPQVSRCRGVSGSAPLQEAKQFRAGFLQEHFLDLRSLGFLFRDFRSLATRASLTRSLGTTARYCK